MTTTPPAPTDPPAATAREFDVVVFGATGFTGRLVADYLSTQAAAGVRIALAGRNAEKLERVRAELGGRSASWPIVTADSTDRASLDALAARTKVVITTVGPYAAHGLGLVRACAHAGTHYVDLAGEVLFMRDTIDRYDAVARRTGARIVHACGFDSIPSDLGVLALHLAAKADDGLGHLGDTALVVMGMSGGLSGGTIHSLFGELDRAKEDPALAKLARDPYALSPDRSREPKVSRPRAGTVHYDDVAGRWTAPFLMAPINTRVVRRSNALSDYAYGTTFRYDEAMATGEGVAGRARAAAMALGLGGAMASLQFGPTRALAERVLPAPGEGPSERSRAKGYFKILLHASTPAGVAYRCLVSSQGDPGYVSTARMLSVAALTLAGDPALLPDRAGVLTPATGIGAVLIDNLKAAGMRIEAARA